MGSWNCQGLGNPLTFRRVKDIRKRIDPDIMFLSETKNPDDFVSKKLRWAGYEKIAIVSPQGVGGGGLALAGDFNDITCNDEKKGGPLRAESSFSDFRSFLGECDLFDIQHSGDPLSWRGVRYSHVVRCRLDRAIANSMWAELYPTGRCAYLPFEGSDHKPVLTILEPSTEEIRKVVFSIHADKAPGPDGFSASFYHANWSSVGPIRS